MGDICLMQIYADYRLMLLRNPTNLQQPGLATERRAESIFNLPKLKSDASDAGTSARRRHQLRFTAKKSDEIIFRKSQCLLFVRQGSIF